MKLTLTDIGLDIYQDSDELIWDITLDNKVYSVHLSIDDLSTLIHRLKYEEEAMEEKLEEYYHNDTYDEDEDLSNLPEGTDDYDSIFSDDELDF